eukprot:1482741-Pleurochrysis_carterae.AAC.5
MAKAIKQRTSIGNSKCMMGNGNGNSEGDFDGKSAGGVSPRMHMSSFGARSQRRIICEFMLQTHHAKLASRSSHRARRSIEL